MTMCKMLNKKAFTIIELIVVIAILGILVLLGLPRLLGRTEEAKITVIRHDIKAIENKVSEIFIDGDVEFLKWADSSKDLSILVSEGKLYETRGLVKINEDPDVLINVEKGNYKIVPDEVKEAVKTRLSGDFYVNEGGKVYYERDKVGNINSEEGKCLDLDYGIMIPIDIPVDYELQISAGPMSVGPMSVGPMSVGPFSSVFNMSQPTIGSEMRLMKEHIEGNDKNAIVKFAAYEMKYEDSIYTYILQHVSNGDYVFIDIWPLEDAFLSDEPIIEIIKYKNETHPKGVRELLPTTIHFADINDGKMIGCAEKFIEIHQPSDNFLFDVNYNEIQGWNTWFTPIPQDLIIPDVISRFGNQHPVETIGVKAFQGAGISTLVIPDSVTLIKGESFMEAGLNKVTLGENVETIESYAFYDNNLSTIELPIGIKNIKTSVFSENKLTEIIIPDTIKEISNYVFSNNNLTSVIIGNNITRIGSGAFQDNKIESVSLGNNLKTVSTRAFAGNKLETIVFPDSLLKLEGWSLADNETIKEIVLGPNVVMEEGVLARGQSGYKNLNNQYEYNGAGTYKGTLTGTWHYMGK